MKVQIFRSIRGRLTLWYVIILGLIFFISDIILYQTFKQSMLDTIDHTLLTAAEEVEFAIAKVPQEKWPEEIKRVERAFLVNRLFIQILKMPRQEDESLQLIARSGVLIGNIPLSDLWAKIPHRFPKAPLYLDANEKSPATHPLRIIVFPVSPKGEKGYLIQVGTSLKKIFHTLKNFLLTLLISGPLLLFVSSLGGYLLLTRALRPVGAVVQTARKISAEDLSLRIDARGRKDEIGLLITTFNEMISRLERSVEQIKQFSSEASHDLKTPLTIIRGEIEIALRKERTPEEYKKALSSIHEESSKLEKLIDNLLLLSRIADREHPFRLENVAIDEILLDVFEKLELLARQKGLVYLIDRVSSAIIRGNDILLNRLVMNLLDNAIKFTPRAGKVEISLAKTGGQVTLAVRDSGPGIPAESLPHIFDRFYHLGQSQGGDAQGSGLGLFIARGIADIHRAEIKVDSRIGKGTTMRVIFPVIPERKRKKY